MATQNTLCPGLENLIPSSRERVMHILIKEGKKEKASGCASPVFPWGWGGGVSQALAVVGGGQHSVRVCPRPPA